MDLAFDFSLIRWKYKYLDPRNYTWSEDVTSTTNQVIFQQKQLVFGVYYFFFFVKN